MKIFLDTSFLCSLYREDCNTKEALSYAEKQTAPYWISNLVLFEFKQSSRLQVFRFQKDRSQGFAEKVFTEIQIKLTANLKQESLIIAGVDWPEVHSIAEQLSDRHTISGGHRTLDVLHVATALHVKATNFLTFDDNQAKLAKKAGLKTNLK